MLNSGLTIAGLLSSDTWTIASGICDGYPKIMRYRSDMSGDLDRSQHPHLILLQWDYLEAEGKDGLPSVDDQDDMELFEDTLFSAIQGELGGLIVCVTTTKGSRTWAIYVQSVEEFAEKFSVVHTPEDGRPVSVGIWMDPDWNYVFKEVLMAVEE